jgi:hypothetical protein
MIVAEEKSRKKITFFDWLLFYKIKSTVTVNALNSIEIVAYTDTPYRFFVALYHICLPHQKKLIDFTENAQAQDFLLSEVIDRTICEPERGYCFADSSINFYPVPRQKLALQNLRFSGSNALMIIWLGRTVKAGSENQISVASMSVVNPQKGY